MELDARGLLYSRALRVTVGARAFNPSRQGFNITLDSRVLKTPAKKPLAVPSEPLANAIAAEWECQVGLGAKNGRDSCVVSLGCGGPQLPGVCAKPTQAHAPHLFPNRPSVSSPLQCRS